MARLRACPATACGYGYTQYIIYMDTQNRNIQDSQTGARQPDRCSAPSETGTDRWLSLAGRFFDAATTEDEERELRRFLLTPEGQDSRFDELRAYMAFAASGRASALASRPAAPAKRLRLRPAVRWAAAAVLVAGILLPATVRLMRNADEVCVAYVGGKRITEREAVLDNVHGVMEDVLVQDEDFSMEQQLGDMFDTLEENTGTTN